MSLNNVTPTADNSASWSFTFVEMCSMGFSAVGTALALQAVFLNVRSVSRSVCRKPVYILALADSILASIGLWTATTIIGSRFISCTTKMYITTLPLNLSPIAMCITLTLIAEASLVSSKSRNVFRWISGFFIVLQGLFLFLRFMFTTSTPLDAKGACTNVSSVQWIILPNIMQVISVLLCTGVFIMSLAEKGLIRKNLISGEGRKANDPNQHMALFFSTPTVNATGVMEQGGASLVSTRSQAEMSRDSKRSRSIEALARRVEYLCIGVVLSTIVIFIYILMVQLYGNNWGTPVKIENVAYGFRSFALATVCYVNGIKTYRKATEASRKHSQHSTHDLTSGNGVQKQSHLGSSQHLNNAAFAAHYQIGSAKH